MPKMMSRSVTILCLWTSVSFKFISCTIVAPNSTSGMREKQNAPILPDQFSLTMTTLAETNKTVYRLKMNFDLPHSLVSCITDSLGGAYFPSSSIQNRTFSRTLLDYNSGLSFTMPVGTWLLSGAGCSVSAIDNPNLDPIDSDRSTVVYLKNARALFEWNQSTAVYAGQRDFNGMPTDVWVSQRSNNDMKMNITTTVETYWLHEDRASSGDRILVGVVSYRALPNGTNLEALQSTVSDFNAAPFYWKTFDVVDCLQNGKEQTISFGLKVQNYGEVEMRMPVFETAIRNALSNLTATSPTQLTDIRVMPGDAENELRIFVTVSDWVNYTARGTNKIKYQSAAEVVNALRRLFDEKDLTFAITFARRTQSATFLKGSIKSSRDPTTATDHPTTIPPTETSTAAHEQNS
ncbi:uncharacterized protein LOC129595047 [Paramacrobiotus metropolitanus]|uniref:uncharacterized protein LOC129595047 n=1 Tax=Paramacrobiotus metropolitanus TaxID=2943436 RepID=UPI0024458322|nr:uncharacterized protein LOC129595047 [Paramacrobiotus metropolitanus]